MRPPFSYLDCSFSGRIYLVVSLTLCQFLFPMHQIRVSGINLYHVLLHLQHHHWLVFALQQVILEKARQYHIPIVYGFLHTIIFFSFIFSLKAKTNTIHGADPSEWWVSTSAAEKRQQSYSKTLTQNMYIYILQTQSISYKQIV